MKSLIAGLTALAVSAGLSFLVPGTTAHAHVDGDVVECRVPDNAPTPPCINALDGSGGTTLTVGWSAQGTPGYTSYNISWSPGDSQIRLMAWDPQITHYGEDNYGYTITGLYPGNTYTVVVQGCWDSPPLPPIPAYQGCGGSDDSTYTMEGFAAPPPRQGAPGSPTRESPPREGTRPQTVIPGVMSPGLG